MESFLTDLRLAARSLLRAPGFTAAAVLTLALGIAATTALFSVVYAVLLRPLPYPDAGRMVELYQVDAEGNRGNFSGPNFVDLHERTRSFAALARAGGTNTVSVLGPTSQPPRSPSWVSPSRSSACSRRAWGIPPTPS